MGEVVIVAIVSAVVNLVTVSYWAGKVTTKVQSLEARVTRIEGNIDQAGLNVLKS